MTKGNLGSTPVQLPNLAEEKSGIQGTETTCLRSLGQFVAKLGVDPWFPDFLAPACRIPELEESLVQAAPYTCASDTHPACA